VNARRRFLKTVPADPYPGLQLAWQRFLRGETLGIFAEIERAALTPSNETTLYQRMVERLDGFRQFLRVAADRDGTGIWDLPWPGADEGLRRCTPASLKLSVPAIARLDAWQDRYRALDLERPLAEQGFDWREFHAAGRDVALAIKEHLGPRIYVEYLPLDEVRHGVQMRLFGL
jgi:hypothetical protein